MPSMRNYWDELGWPDAFASPSFTSRQQVYARHGRMYTPQAVVDGREERVGSNATPRLDLSARATSFVVASFDAAPQRRSMQWP